MSKVGWCGPAAAHLHPDVELDPPKESLACKQYCLADPDLALIRECGLELSRRGSIGLGEELLLLSERLSDHDFRVHLGLAIAHMRRITAMSDGKQYSTSGVFFTEYINSEWVPVPEYAECGQQCKEHLDLAIQLAPEDLKESLVAFRDKCLE